MRAGARVALSPEHSGGHLDVDIFGRGCVIHPTTAPRGYLAMSGGNFGCLNWGGQGYATGILWVAQRCHNSQDCSPRQRAVWATNANGAKVEKPHCPLWSLGTTTEQNRLTRPHCQGKPPFMARDPEKGHSLKDVGPTGLPTPWGLGHLSCIGEGSWGPASEPALEEDSLVGCHGNEPHSLCQGTSDSVSGPMEIARWPPSNQCFHSIPREEVASVWGSQAPQKGNPSQACPAGRA